MYQKDRRMRICQPHWDKLRTAIKNRGLSHLGAKSGEEAITDAVTELKGGTPDYDPLMSCHWMITSQALKMGGLYLMGAKPDGTEYCPICEAVAHMNPPEGMTKEQQELSWINGPADAALEECRRLGIVSAIQ
jgi:hypothetical protein